MTDWNKLKVVDLKAELKQRGLAQTGLKPALVARLAETESQEGSDSEATVQGDTGKHDASSAASPDTISPVLPPSSLGAEFLPDAPAPPTPQAPLESSVEVAATESCLLDESTVTAPPETAPTQSPNTLTSSQPSEPKDSHRSSLPSADPQEVAEDRQKRKRRSESPPLSASDAARKRLRQGDQAAEAQDEVVTTKSDAEWIEKHSATDIEANATAKGVERAGEGAAPGPTIVDVAKEEVNVTRVEDVPNAEKENLAASEETMEVDHLGESKPDPEGAIASEPHDDSPSRTRDSRFRNLFPETPQGAATAISQSRDSASDSMDVEPDRVISPAIHPATAALYIRDFMRPLNSAQLKTHLANLATPPDSDTDPNVIVNFYLDPIRTHAFVSFANTSAASRVRNALHDRIWPDERTRKPLWVDFVPLEKVDEWISEEQATHPGGRSQSKKWEVYYDTDRDRHVTATLQEVINSTRLTQPLRQPSISASLSQPPAAPRSIPGALSGPRVPAIHPQRAAANFAKLDELFNSTTTKPVLYWEPVPKNLAHRRLDNLEVAMSRDASAGRRISGEINRYTFEDGDVLVDRGPEIFPGIRPPLGHRAPRGGGGPRGGFQGRGGFGGGPDRRYDSYRGETGRRNSRDDRHY